jgi:hypothetical protein
MLTKQINGWWLKVHNDIMACLIWWKVSNVNWCLIPYGNQHGCQLS